MTLFEVFSFFGSVMASIFNGLDTVYVDTSLGITVLDIFCAIMFFSITIDFITSILSGGNTSK